jgi:O-antigen/teichoic acid export membrane protein
MSSAPLGGLVNLQKLGGRQGLARSSAVVFAGNSTARLLGFLFAVAAARILGTQDFGRFAFGLTVASIAAILVTNAPRGLSRFLARAHDDRQEQDTYFSNWLMVVLLTLGVSALLLAPISALTGIEGWMVVAVGANLLGVTVFETYREAQRGLRRFTAMVVFYLAANLIQLCAILLAGRVGWRSPSLFLTIYGLASLVALVVMQRASPIALVSPPSPRVASGEGDRKVRATPRRPDDLLCHMVWGRHPAARQACRSDPDRQLRRREDIGDCPGAGPSCHRHSHWS